MHTTCLIYLLAWQTRYLSSSVTHNWSHSDTHSWSAVGYRRWIFIVLQVLIIVFDKIFWVIFWNDNLIRYHRKKTYDLRSILLFPEKSLCLKFFLDVNVLQTVYLPPLIQMKIQHNDFFCSLHSPCYIPRWRFLRFSLFFLLTWDKYGKPCHYERHFLLFL